MLAGELRLNIVNKFIIIKSVEKIIISLLGKKGFLLSRKRGIFVLRKHTRAGVRFRRTGRRVCDGLRAERWGCRGGTEDRAGRGGFGCVGFSGACLSAGPGCGGVGSRTVRQRLWGCPFRYPISERRGGFVGFRKGASVRRKSAESSVPVFAAGGGPCRFSCRPMRLPRRVG